MTPPGVDKPTLGVVPAPVPTFAEEPGKQAGKEEPKPDEETASETSSAKAALPSEWPSSIVPQQAAGETEDGEPSAPVGLAEAKNAPRTPDTSLISILLTSALSWQWLLTKSDASAQVFAYMPVLIATSLKIDESQVTTVSLEAWEPPNWSGDGADVYVVTLCLSRHGIKELIRVFRRRSVWVGHMPTAKVNELSELITNSSSPFYTEGKPIIRQLSSCVDPSLPLLSLQNSLGLAPDADPDAANGENDEGRMSNKKTAFVASAAALGAIILAVGAFFGSKYAMNRKAESAHSQRDDESYHSGSSRSFTSRSQEIPGYDTAAAPMEQMGGLARDSEYYGSQSDYPVTERDDMRDTYGRASTRPPTMPLPEPPEAYRDSYDSALAAPLVRNGQSSFYPTERSFINTARSGSGSSVQSEVIGSGRRQSSVDIPIRDTWWKHASQWGHQAGEVDNTRIQSVMSDPVPKSGRVISFDRPFSASSMSTLRTADGGAAFGSMGPFGNGNPFGNAPHGKPAKISGPYLQDNSLML